MVQTGWTQEDPTDAVDEFAVGRAWWCRGVGGGGGAATNSGACVYHCIVSNPDFFDKNVWIINKYGGVPASSR